MTRCEKIFNINMLKNSSSQERGEEVSPLGGEGYGQIFVENTVFVASGDGVGQPIPGATRGA